MDCFFFPEDSDLACSGAGGSRESQVRSEKEVKTPPAVKPVHMGARMSSTIASPEDSSTENPQGRNLGMTLLSIFQICASLSSVCTHPAGTAGSYIGQGRDRVRT